MGLGFRASVASRVYKVKGCCSVILRAGVCIVEGDEEAVEDDVEDGGAEKDEHADMEVTTEEVAT